MDTAPDSANDLQPPDYSAFRQPQQGLFHGPGYPGPSYAVLQGASSAASFTGTPRTGGPFAATAWPSSVSTQTTSRRALNASTRRKSVDKIEQLTDLTYVLTPVGQILYASGAVAELLGYTADEVVGHNVMEFIHVLDVEKYVHAFNEAITERSKLLHYHRFRQKDGGFALLEAVGHAIYDDYEFTMDLHGNEAPACKCFVLTARRYPSNSTTSLDSYLETRLENEAMKAELRAWDSAEAVVDSRLSMDMGEEGDPAASAGPVHSQMPGPLADLRPSGTTIAPPTQAHSYSYPQFLTYGPTAASYKTYQAPAALVFPEVSAEFSMSAGLPKSRTERAKRANFERKTTTSPQMTVPKSPARAPKARPGDAAITSVDPLVRKKTKKAKVDTDDHVCTDCGTTESPEWRKGLNGPKTLCNACGLRFSKRQKKVEGHQAGGPADLAVQDDPPPAPQSRPPLIVPGFRRSNSSSVTQLPSPVFTRTVSASYPSATFGGRDTLMTGPVDTTQTAAAYWSRAKRESNDDPSSSIPLTQFSPLV